MYPTFASPTRTILSTSLAFFLSLWIRANSTLSLSAIAVTLFAPPASGLTIIEFLHSGIFSFIHFRTAGSAYKLSTGISKNPCIWLKRGNYCYWHWWSDWSTWHGGPWWWCGRPPPRSTCWPRAWRRWEPGTCPSCPAWRRGNWVSQLLPAIIKTKLLHQLLTIRLIYSLVNVSGSEKVQIL